MREHLCSIRSELERLLRTGEPDALKGARPVRGGAVGNGLAQILPEAYSGKSKALNSTALAAYSTTCQVAPKREERGGQRKATHQRSFLVLSLVYDEASELSRNEK